MKMRILCKATVEAGKNIYTPVAVVNSSANTTYTTTTVVDGTEWDLSGVLVGDLITAGGKYGYAITVDDSTNTVTVGGWVGGTPTNTDVAYITRPVNLRLDGTTQYITLTAGSDWCLANIGVSKTAVDAETTYTITTIYDAGLIGGPLVTVDTYVKPIGRSSILIPHWFCLSLLSVAASCTVRLFISSSNSGDTLTRLFCDISSESPSISDSVLETTIATVTDNSNFTLNHGQAIDDYYNGAIVAITDANGSATISPTSLPTAIRFVTDYVQVTKTVTLNRDVPFTLAVGDIVKVLALSGEVNSVLSAGNTPISTSDILALLTAALNAEIPAIPTAGSINDIIKDTDGLLAAVDVEWP
jgi:hypothetical protein